MLHRKGKRDTGLYFWQAIRRHKWQTHISLQFHHVKTGTLAFFSPNGRFVNLSSNISLLSWEEWQYLKYVLINKRKSDNFMQVLMGSFKTMDFESGCAAYPAMIHIAHGRRDMPYLPMNLVFRNIKKNICFP
jgi:hypothetical protein